MDIVKVFLLWCWICVLLAVKTVFELDVVKKVGGKASNVFQPGVSCMVFDCLCALLMK